MASREEEERANSQAPPVSEERREEGDVGCRCCSGSKAGPRGSGRRGRRWAMLQAERRGGGRGNLVALFYFFSLFSFPYFLLC